MNPALPGGGNRSCVERGADPANSCRPISRSFGAAPIGVTNAAIAGNVSDRPRSPRKEAAIPASFVVQGGHGVDAGCSPCREVAGESRNGGHHENRQADRGHIAGRETEEQSCDEPSCG